jgi:glycyl-tRNA synthetase alpha chain
MKQFETYESECVRLNREGLVLPAYDFCLKCSHAFNLLEARGAFSVTERITYIARVRKLARLCAQAYMKQREELGFPLLGGGK